MKVFISWSGLQSKFIAETLCEWLEQVLQAVEPWISTDIEKGARWNNQIAEKLSESKVAIVCLTKDNLESKWIHFECGAIAKTVDAYVCTFLFDVNPTSVKQPLSAFQATTNTRDDIMDMLKSINLALEKFGKKSLREGALEKIFEANWPRLKEKLDSAPTSSSTLTSSLRTDRELLEETLQLVRSLQAGKTVIYQDRDLNAIVDFWLDKYADSKRIDGDAHSLTGHEDQIHDYIMRFPEMKLIFGTDELLKKRIKERIPFLSPY